MSQTTSGLLTIALITVVMGGTGLLVAWKDLKREFGTQQRPRQK